MGREVVINRCYGGFSLSEAGLLAYAKRKGITLYPEPGTIVASFTDYWTKPPSEPREYGDDTLSTRDMERDDPDLVAVIKKLGKKASGRCADLKIVEIPSDVEWEIGEYDGIEWVAEKHREWS